MNGFKLVLATGGWSAESDGRFGLRLIHAVDDRDNLLCTPGMGCGGVVNVVADRDDFCPDCLIEVGQRCNEAVEFSPLSRPAA